MNTELTRADIEDALPALAAGALDAEARAAVLEGLKRHPDLAAAARALGAVLPAALAALPEVPPAPALKARMMAEALKVRPPTRPVAAQAAPTLMDRLSRWLAGALFVPRYASLAAAALALLSIGLITYAWQSERAGVAQLAAQQEQLRQQLAAQQETLRQQAAQQESLRQQAAAQQALIAALSAPDARAVNLNGSNPSAVARVSFAPGSRTGVLHARGLPALPEAQRYQLWLFDATGTPQPSILFSEAANGVPIVAQVDLAQYVNFAVSVEPRAGSRAPTGPVVLIAKS